MSDGPFCSRSAVILLVTATALLLTPSLFTRDPWNPDEPRATEVAREMVALGNYLVPHLNGAPYSDKPPVFYWLAAGFWHLGFGTNSGRMVSLLATVGTALVVYALGRRLHSPQTGLLAALITLTTLLFIFISRFGVLDPLLALFTTAAIYCTVQAFGGGRTLGRWWLGAYACAALAVLTKGPAGLAVPLLVGAACGIVRRRGVARPVARPSGAEDLRVGDAGHVAYGGWWHLAGAALLVGLVAAWLVPACFRGGPEYTKDILFQQTAKRMGEEAVHHQPPYFYVMYAPAFFFPWTLLLVLAFGWAWREGRARGDATGLLATAWLVLVFVFFSLFSGKRERYLLPLVPAAGLLCARYLVAVASGEVPFIRAHRVLWKATLVVLGLAAVGLVVVALAPEAVAAKFTKEADILAELKAAMTPGLLVGAGVFGAMVLAACLWGLQARPGAEGESRRLAATIAATLLLSLAVDILATPVINRLKSGRDLIEQAGHYIRDADEVFLYQSDFSGVYNLFARRVRMPEVGDAEELLAKVAPGRRVAVIAKEQSAQALLGKASLHLVARERVGHRKIVVIANW